MMRKLILTALMIVLPLVGWTAVTPDDTPDGRVSPLTEFYARFNVIDFDSITGDLADTGRVFATNSFGTSQPFPDKISFWVELDASSYTTATTLDSVLLEIDVTNVKDSTNLSERGLAWLPIWLNADIDTVAMAGGGLTTTTYKTGGLYTLSAAQLSSMAGSDYFRLTVGVTGDATEDDTVRMRIDMIQVYTGWKDE